MSTDYALIGEGMKQAVPWVGSNGVEFEHIGPDKVVATIADDTRQHNHVGGLHAAMISASA
jgi:acyl-coenzyme A thioesterase PaaI-like protein